MDIFERMLAGGIIPKDDPEIRKLWLIVDQTIVLSVALNNSTDIKTTREVLSIIIDKPIKANTTIFNNLVQTKSDLEANWKICLDKSWLSRVIA